MVNCIPPANRHSKTNPLTGLCRFVSVFLCVLPLLADDWPQWLGPQRDAVWREGGLAEKFPADGPPVRWRTAIGSGPAPLCPCRAKRLDYDAAVRRLSG